MKIPMNLEKLRRLKEALDDREAKLEADLAIKEHEDLEATIITLVLVTSEVRKAEQQLRIAKRPEKNKKEKVVQINTRINYYKEQIKILKQSLIEETGAVDRRFAKLEEKKKQAVIKARKEFEIHNETFKEHGISLLEIIPSLSDIIEVSLDIH